jgi:diguanylate cyclase (GGDEF)-like protein
LLVIDDSAVNRKILDKMLSGTYGIIEAANGKEALEKLGEHSGSIAGMILDLVMPVMDGFEFMREISGEEKYSNIPILVATSDKEQGSEQICLELGAWDFVQKPYDAAILKLRLKNIISRSRINVLEEIKRASEHDALTGLYNRKKFYEATRAALDENAGAKFVLVRFDIDHFRLFNSFFGEQAGDDLLKFIAASLERDAGSLGIRTYGRIESDVFGLCMPCDSALMDRLISGINRLFAEYIPSYYIEPSFGVYVIDDPGLPVETMYARATMAAEKCKGKYMLHVAYYDQGMTDMYYKAQKIMNEAQSALDGEQFVVYFQPKYNISTEMPYGAEALARWKHPERGMISPAEFIPVFERNGFIGKLDYYMWEHVCMLLRKWIDEGLSPAPVSVNVSRANMYNPQLIDMLTEIVEKYSIPPRMLNLELTESAYMDNPDLMRKTVAELQSRGFVIMMDDFGSGYSSLNTLKDIMVDVLKVDMKFLPTGQHNARSERILASVIRMAGWLNLPVIVEGVETKEQKNFLESIGCGYIQGFYFARPMPAESYEALLRDPKIIQTPVAEVENDGVVDIIWSASPQVDKLFQSIAQPVGVYEFVRGELSPIRVNQAFIDMFGRDAGGNEFSRAYRKYISAEDLARIYAVAGTACEERRVAECDYTRFAEGGGSMYIHMKASYVQPIKDGGVLFVALTDISERIELEREINKYRLLLEAHDRQA